MLDVLYNLLIILMVLFWLLSFKKTKRPGRLRRFVLKNALVVGLSLWVLASILVAVFVVEFDYFGDSRDVDDAVDAAVVNWTSGINPYTEFVVPRFSEMGHFAIFGDNSDSIAVWSYGPYNYLPFDLMFYSAAHAALGEFGSPVWFVITNIMCASFALFLFYRLLDIKNPYLYSPFAIMMVIFYAFDNTSLTMLLIIGALYLKERSPVIPETLAVMAMGVACLTKIFAVIPFIVLVLFILQREIKNRDLREIAKAAVAIAAACMIAVLVITPFGMSDVLDSTVFVYSSGEVRDDMPIGGTVLSELIGGNSYYSYICLGTMAAAVLMGLLLRSSNDRVLLFLSVFLLVSVKSTLAPFCIAWIFLALKYRDVLVLRDKESETTKTPPSQAPDS